VPPAWSWPGATFFVVFLLALHFSFPLGYLLSGFYGRARQARLRREFAALPGESWAAVLLPMRGRESPEVLELVEPLLRDLGISSALVPAPAPARARDEVTPAAVGAPQEATDLSPE